MSASGWWRLLPAAVLGVAGCQLATIPPGTVFHCEADGGCGGQAGYACGVDGFCRPPLDGGTDAGTDGGSDAGGCGTCPLGTICGGGGAPGVCAFDTSFCSDAGWCWENPRPQGNPLHDAWAFSATDVWAVGAAGTVVRFNGSVWYHMPIPTSRDLFSVWGSSPSDVWVVGAGGTALHYDGTRWRDTTGPFSADLTAVWGSSPSDVWVCGGFTVGRWDGGGSWATQPIGGQDAPVRALWGSGPSDVYAVGGVIGASRAYHWNGSAWTRAPSTATFDATAIWGLGPTQVWMTTNEGLFVLDGGTFTPGGIPGQQALVSVGGSGPNDLWAGGHQGYLAHSDGGAWGLVQNYDTTQPDLLAIASVPGGPVRVVGTGGALGVLSESTGGATFLAPVLPDLFSGWGAGPLDVWAGGQMGYYFTRGSSGQWFLGQRPAHEALLSAWGFSRTDFWFAGSLRRTEQFTGSTWTEQAVGPADSASNRAIWGGASNDLLVVGDLGAVSRGAGTSFSAVPLPGPPVTLRAVSGTSVSSGWIAGDLGSVFSWNGSALTAEDAGTTATLNAVAAVTTDEAWVAGEGGLILHRAGGVWSPLPPVPPVPDAGTLRALWATSSTDVWAVGDRGVALHWDGSRWSYSDTGTVNDLTAVWALPNDGGVFVAGEKGTILRHP